VATEVRTLAGRSASAAKEIKALIKDSVQKVADGSVFVSRSGQTLEQIVASVKKVSDIVAEIAAASREQSSGIAQVNRAVLQMDELTQQNAALVEQATTASQSMAHEAHSLHEMMGGYRLGDHARSTTSASHTNVAPEADTTNEEPAPRAKRRSPGRTRRRATGSAQVAAAVAVTEDGEWQEF
jgi:methyl-accepting chemotaxis protein